jgi:hypothetical protein
MVLQTSQDEIPLFTDVEAKGVKADPTLLGTRTISSVVDNRHIREMIYGISLADNGGHKELDHPRELLGIKRYNLRRQRNEDRHGQTFRCLPLGKLVGRTARQNRVSRGFEWKSASALDSAASISSRPLKTTEATGLSPSHRFPNGQALYADMITTDGL